ncbi:transporter substrate-binding domain-containing protein [Phaeovulum sp. W22_SRMD_FR3]|uniref:transporter substrate-binding domain-containing protein n=1 Tax=Phaeovulum sp. W22_SRMD_FR3 TaxID=3240274 RepID=UPI003F9C10B0
MTPLAQHFAPHGLLRIALNHGNRILVSRDREGRAQGISVDLAQALAAHLDLPLAFQHYERAVDVSASATEDAWDVCFLAVDPERARTIAFTDPYVKIEGSYLAGADCPAGDAVELIAAGLPVGSVVGSAYTLTLQRLPGADHLVLYPDIFAALDSLDRGQVAAIAGIRAVMEKEAVLRPGTRVLEPAFMEIRQAMAMPQGRPEASAALAAFLADLARRGVTGDILEAHGVDRSCALTPA